MVNIYTIGLGTSFYNLLVPLHTIGLGTSFDNLLVPLYTNTLITSINSDNIILNGIVCIYIILFFTNHLIQVALLISIYITSS